MYPVVETSDFAISEQLFGLLQNTYSISVDLDIPIFFYNTHFENISVTREEFVSMIRELILDQDDILLKKVGIYNDYYEFFMPSEDPYIISESDEEVNFNFNVERYKLRGFKVSSKEYFINSMVYRRKAISNPQKFNIILDLLVNKFKDKRFCFN